MPEVTKRSGMFVWADLSTPDPEAAKAFYADVLDWSYHDVPAGDFGSYTLCRVKGKDVAGIGPQPPEEAERGVPPMWTGHVLVDDVDALAGRAAELGGGVVMDPMDVPGAGRLAVIHDPQGGVLVPWEDRGHTGAELFNENGALCWNELACRDREAAMAYYADLFGWEYEEIETPAGPYQIIRNDGRPNGGMLLMDEQWPADAPTCWTTYFWMDDVDAATERVRSGGGSVHVEPFDMGAGRMAVVADPAGAVFTLFRGRGGPMEE